MLFNLSSSRPGLPKENIQYRAWRKVNIDAFNVATRSQFDSFNPDNLAAAIDEYNAQCMILADRFACDPDH